MSLQRCYPAALGIVLAFSWGCSSVTIQAAQSGGWTKYEDKSGFEVQLPAGWHTESNNDGQVIIRSADKTMLVLVQPFRPPEPSTAAKSLEKLIDHQGGLFPNSQISNLQQVQGQPDEAVAKVTFGSGSRASALCYLNGNAGMLYVISAPAGSFEARRPTLVKVLESFKYGGGDASSAGTQTSGPLTYTSWSDPKENAFSIEVPNGWKVVGGLYRLAPIDLRRQVNTISPDGQIQIQANDARVSAYVPYGPSAQVRGLHEGQSYQVNGVTYTILHPMRGDEYSKKYVEVAVKKDHPDLKIDGSKDRPDIEQWAERKIPAGAGSQAPKLSAGETDFSYTDHGRTFEGAVVAVTIDPGGGSGGIWQGIPCTVCATPGKMPQGMDVLVHMMENTNDNEAWSARQSETTKRFMQLVMQHHEEAMAELKETYEKFTGWLQENQREWSNILNNQVDLRGPGGTTIKAEAGHNYYWSGPKGIVGSDAPTAPDVNLTPLTKF